MGGAGVGGGGRERSQSIWEEDYSDKHLTLILHLQKRVYNNKNTKAMC